MLKTIKFRGRYFSDEVNIEIFRENERLSIIYGKNGSGKSTITDAVLQATGNTTVEGIDYASIYDENDLPCSDTSDIHIFNEDYVNKRVKVKDDGLKTIVLLGELGDLDDQIQNIKQKIEAESKKNEGLKATLETLQDQNNPNSEAYCKSQIYKALSGDTHWADREKRIKNSSRNASVKDDLLDKIFCLNPKESMGIIRERFDKNLTLLNQIRDNEAEQINNTIQISAAFSEEQLQALLKQKVERPSLSDREEKIIRMIEDGKLNNVNEVKSIFLKENTTQCPFCFQKVTPEYIKGLVESIEIVLSKELGEHQEKLNKSII